MNRMLQLGVNKEGRDFVIGDIHGKYTQLMAGLARINFDFEKDRLIAVGDLVDRGKENMEVLALIGEPWFYTVIGNHELIMCDALGDTPQPYHGAEAMHHWHMCGGVWYKKLKAADIFELRNTYAPIILDELPVGIELIAENGKVVAITHAGIPRGWTWTQTRKALECVQKLTDKVVVAVTWTRTRIQSTEEQADILGCDLMINGHTPSRKETWRGNNVFIDLGAHTPYQLVPINILDLFNRMENNE